MFGIDRARDSGARIFDVPIRLIAPNPDQPRRSFDEAGIIELASSIKQVGLIQPLVVRRRGREFVLIAGERRLRALKSLGCETARCIIDDPADEGDPALMAIVENLQREDLHYLEEAECFASLIRDLGLTQEELGKRIGKSQSYVANKLRLLRLPPEVRSRIAAARLTERHARELMKLEKSGALASALETVIAKGLSVNETERLVEKLLADSAPAFKRRPRMIRVFRDYKVFINTVASACDQLRESGLSVTSSSRDVDNGVEILIRVSGPSK